MNWLLLAMLLAMFGMGFVSGWTMRRDHELHLRAREAADAYDRLYPSNGDAS